MHFHVIFIYKINAFRFQMDIVLSSRKVVFPLEPSSLTSDHNHTGRQRLPAGHITLHPLQISSPFVTAQNTKPPCNLTGNRFPRTGTYHFRKIFTV